MSVTTRPVSGVPEIVGVSKAIQEVVRLIDTVAASDCCVLIEGESGTGKELLARRLCLKSNRRDKPFIPVNCAGISESLFESQFFGHVRGAFTGAEQSMLGLVRTADAGTLFLDEVGEIPLNLQPKLLRVIQEQEVMPVGKPIPVKVNTRFIAGTNRNLREMAQRGRFRQDLYFRLNIVRVVVPPLRDRSEDVGPLLDHFSAHYARLYKMPPIADLPRHPQPADGLCLARQRPRIGRLGRTAVRHRPRAGGAGREPAGRSGLAATHAVGRPEPASSSNAGRSSRPWTNPTSTSAKPPGCCKSIAPRSPVSKHGMA